MLSAPAATTLQGKGVFPETHPLWLWNGFGASAPGFARKIMDNADCLLAIGCRFGEVATASFGLNSPENLIHVDIHSEVFHKNYKAKLAIASDAKLFLNGLMGRLKPKMRDAALEQTIARGHQDLWAGWRTAPQPERVTPALFLEALQKRAGPGAIYATDSGNGTFLAMEFLRLSDPGRFIGPIDYSCMGYSVPAAIGAKMANPEKPVIALAGDGAFLMTGLELITAAQYQAPVIVFVLRDGELGQIAQFQRVPLNRATCSVISPYDLEALAKGVGALYLDLPNDLTIEKILGQAFEAVKNKKPVVVNVAIDYSRKTFFTKGVVMTNFWRLPWGDRLRMLARAIERRIVRV
jgi:acetolactate synthase-1/2/3 large subunit